ncbi:hypothetical protein Nmel_000466 [Mimus melanotis]
MPARRLGAAQRFLFAFDKLGFAKGSISFAAVFVSDLREITSTRKIRCVGWNNKAAGLWPPGRSARRPARGGGGAVRGGRAAPNPAQLPVSLSLGIRLRGRQKSGSPEGYPGSHPISAGRLAKPEVAPQR